MKRVCQLTIVVFVLAAAPAFAQAPDTSYNLGVFTIPELPTVPEIDGVLEDSVWASVPEIPMLGDGDSPAAVPGSGDLDIVLKIAWDDETNAVYFGLVVQDESYINTSGHGAPPPYSDAGYLNERLEVVIDGINSGDPSAACGTPNHQQYCFDMRNIVDPWDPDNLYFGMADTPVSTEFTPVLVSEHITSTIQAGADTYPDGFNLDDDFMESAAQIRSTDPDRTVWLDEDSEVQGPVEFVWEIKLVIFEELWNLPDYGYDPADPDMAATGFKGYFEEADQTVKDLEENGVIGFTVQQNDGDLYNYAGNPTREHQTNTTGVAGNWNSSEQLSALIFGPALAGVEDWSLH